MEYPYEPPRLDDLLLKEIAKLSAEMVDIKKENVSLRNQINEANSLISDIATDNHRLKAELLSQYLKMRESIVLNELL